MTLQAPNASGLQGFRASGLQVYGGASLVGLIARFYAGGETFGDPYHVGWFSLTSGDLVGWVDLTDSLLPSGASRFYAASGTGGDGAAVWLSDTYDTGSFGATENWAHRFDAVTGALLSRVNWSADGPFEADGANFVTGIGGSSLSGFVSCVYSGAGLYLNRLARIATDFSVIASIEIGADGDVHPYSTGAGGRPGDGGVAYFIGSDSLGDTNQENRDPSSLALVSRAVLGGPEPDLSFPVDLGGDEHGALYIDNFPRRGYRRDPTTAAVISNVLLDQGASADFPSGISVLGFLCGGKVA